MRMLSFLFGMYLLHDSGELNHASAFASRLTKSKIGLVYTLTILDRFELFQPVLVIHPKLLPTLRIATSALAVIAFSAVSVHTLYPSTLHYIIAVCWEVRI